MSQQQREEGMETTTTTMTIEQLKALLEKDGTLTTQETLPVRRALAEFDQRMIQIDAKLCEREAALEQGQKKLEQDRARLAQCKEFHDKAVACEREHNAQALEGTRPLSNLYYRKLMQPILQAPLQMTSMQPCDGTVGGDTVAMGYEKVGDQSVYLRVTKKPVGGPSDTDLFVTEQYVPIAFLKK